MTNIEIAIEAAKTFYELPGNSCGGALHIVLDDGNIEDDCIEFCRRHCETQSDGFGVLLCDALLALTERERHSVYCARTGISDYDPTEDDENEE